MARPKVNITKEPGLGRRAPSTDMISGFIFGGLAVAGLALNTTSVELKSILDVEALGITSTYDATNKILVWHHLDRFFKRNPSGSVFIRLVAQTVTMTQMADKDLTHAKNLILDAQNKIKWLGIVRNPDMSTYTPTLSGGLDGDVLTAIDKAQGLFDWAFDTFRPLYGIAVEGRQFNGTVAASTDLHTKTDPNVGVVIACDLDVNTRVVTATTPYLYTAAVGDFLGIRSLAKVNENPGWVEQFPLTDTTEGMFVRAGLSSGLSIETYAESLDALHDKAYIIPVYHTDIAGYFFNSDPTCVSLSDDEAYMENGATLSKAARLLRAAYVPKLNNPIPTIDGGKIDPLMISALEAVGNDALDIMVRNGEISAGSVTIDPDQDFIGNGEVMEATFKLRIVGVLRELNGKLSLVASL